MNPENTTLLYFSPTATTQTTLKEIAKGLGKNISNTIDITKPEIRSQSAPEFGNDLVLIGAPVYGGRLPKDAADYFKTLKAKNTPACLVVLYGNREFEDALIELKNIAMDCGFVPLAAAAFIGEHSFSSDEFPIALNRPDKDDLEKAFSFGEQIKTLLNGVDNIADLTPVDVPGNFPYKQDFSMGPFPFIDVTDDCDDCGICATACPKNAIDEENGYPTLDEHCIYCCACIKACPQNARVIKTGPIMDKAKQLNKALAQGKEPQTFLSDK
jgi:NAD-dependent dihydropyrimidine dehydrogenase PreA subunit/flavodoxin